MQSPEFPVGTECTVVEDRDSAEFAGYEMTVSPESSMVVVAADGGDDVTVTNTYAEDPPIVGSSPSGGSVAPQGSSNAGTVETPVRVDTPAPENHVEQPKEEQRGGMLAQTGADVLLLVLVAFFLMGLGLLLVQRRRS